MRLRLFERVRRLAHPRAGWLRPRRDRAGETARHDRPWEARSRPGDGRGQAPSTSPEAAGRHRRNSQDAAGPTAYAASAGGTGPSWPDEAGPPPAEETRQPWPSEPVPRWPSEPVPRWPNQAVPPWVDEPRSVPPPVGGPAGTGGPRGGGGSPPDGRPLNVSPRTSRETAGRAGADPPGVSVDGARARVRRGRYGTAPLTPPAVAPAGRDGGRGESRPGAPAADARQQWLEAQRGHIPAQRPASAVQRPAGAGAARPRLPFAHAHNPKEPSHGDGRRNCGTLEAVLWRQWDAATLPPAEAAAAIDRLAELPQQIKDKLAAGLDGIFVGPGGVPQLDDMTALRGVPLPSGRATWDACAGAYGERKIVVGTRPSPTPDVMCHEVGHALDDIDAPAGRWQSDSAEFRMLYDQCQPHLASDFHRQRGGLGRKEFFADAFAAIASRQRPALVDMLGGNTRTALNVMLYFNRRYGI